jgi:tetratricopeptide (TPR) repeat protein
MGWFNWLTGKTGNAQDPTHGSGETDPYTQGLALASQGDMDGAIRYFSLAIDVQPTFAPGFTNRGVARASRGDIEGAMADFDQAIKLDAREALAFYNRANIRTDAGDYQAAIADYDRALEINPNHANSFYQRGCAWKTIGEWDKAIADFNRAIELHPEDANAYVNRAHARQAKGDTDGAAADFARAKELYGDTGDVLYSVPPAPQGFVWQQMGRSRAFVLRPEAWHFTAVEQGDTVAYFITKQPIPAGAKPGSRQFETGLTMNVLRGLTQAQGIAPSAYARAYVEEVARSPDYRIENKVHDHGDLYISSFIQFSAESDIGRLRQAHHLTGNDKTGTLYLIIFESPERFWDDDGPLAEVILANLMLHPDV